MELQALGRSGFLQFPPLPLVLPLGRNVLLRAGNLSV